MTRDPPEKCIAKRNELEEVIYYNKKGIFHDITTADVFEDKDDFDQQIQKPSHIYDTLDSQRDQENADDNEKETEDDPNFAARNPDRVKHQENDNVETFKYKRIQLPDDIELRQQTRALVPEQRQILDTVIEHCKTLVKARKSFELCHSWKALDMPWRCRCRKICNNKGDFFMG